MTLSNAAIKKIQDAIDLISDRRHRPLHEMMPSVSGLIMLNGPAGSGKTHAAAEAVSRRPEHFIRVSCVEEMYAFLRRIGAIEGPEHYSVYKKLPLARQTMVEAGLLIRELYHEGITHITASSPGWADASISGKVVLLDNVGFQEDVTQFSKLVSKGKGITGGEWLVTQLTGRHTAEGVMPVKLIDGVWEGDSRGPVTAPSARMHVFGSSERLIDWLDDLGNPDSQSFHQKDRIQARLSA